jgi:hypothetical protein
MVLSISAGLFSIYANPCSILIRNDVANTAATVPYSVLCAWAHLGGRHGLVSGPWCRPVFQQPPRACHAALSRSHLAHASGVTDGQAFAEREPDHHLGSRLPPWRFLTGPNVPATSANPIAIQSSALGSQSPCPSAAEETYLGRWHLACDGNSLFDRHARVRSIRETPIRSSRDFWGLRVRHTGRAHRATAGQLVA